MIACDQYLQNEPKVRRQTGREWRAIVPHSEGVANHTADVSIPTGSSTGQCNTSRSLSAGCFIIWRCYAGNAGADANSKLISKLRPSLSPILPLELCKWYYIWWVTARVCFPNDGLPRTEKVCQQYRCSIH